MKKLRRLLTAVDFSTPSRHAAERAALLSHEHQAQLELLHVADLSPLQHLQQLASGKPDALLQVVASSTEKKMETLAEAISDLHDSVEAKVLQGALLKTIAGEIKSYKPDVVVCGASGEGLVRRLFLGSTAERVLSSASRPVLLVKQAPRAAYHRVLVPVDFSPVSLRAIALARSFAPEATLVLLHAFEVPFEGRLRYARVSEKTIDRCRILARQQATAKMRELCKAAKLPEKGTHFMVVHGTPALSILQQETESDYDLIVIGKQGEGMVEELLLGSVTRHVLSESKNDVLVLP